MIRAPSVKSMPPSRPHIERTLFVCNELTMPRANQNDPSLAKTAACKSMRTAVYEHVQISRSKYM